MMERLTKRNPDGRADFAAKNRHKCDVCAVLMSADKRAFLDVLEKCAAYEDTGMTPEQVERWKELRTPKAVLKTDFIYSCPSCKNLVEGIVHGQRCRNYCDHCGQAILWDND